MWGYSRRDFHSGYLQRVQLRPLQCVEVSIHRQRRRVVAVRGVLELVFYLRRSPPEVRYLPLQSPRPGLEGIEAFVSEPLIVWAFRVDEHGIGGAFLGCCCGRCPAVGAARRREVRIEPRSMPMAGTMSRFIHEEERSHCLWVRFRRGSWHGH